MPATPLLSGRSLKENREPCKEEADGATGTRFTFVHRQHLQPSVDQESSDHTPTMPPTPLTNLPCSPVADTLAPSPHKPRPPQGSLVSPPVADNHAPSPQDSFSFSLPSALPQHHSRQHPEKGAWSEKSYMFSSPVHLLNEGMVRGMSHDSLGHSVEGVVRGVSHDPLDGLFSRRLPNVCDSPALMDKISLEMARRLTRTSSTLLKESHMVPRADDKSLTHIKSSEVTRTSFSGGDSRRRGSCYNRYSATLGIDGQTLTRRKLREREGHTRPSHRCASVLHQHHQGEGPRPSSPSLLSASLGITELRSHMARDGGERYTPTPPPPRAMKENRPPPVKSCDLTETPPPMILKILESNVRAKKSLLADNAEVKGSEQVPKSVPFAPSTVSDTPPSPCTKGEPLEPPPPVSQPCPPHQRFKSPWRWSHRHNYTPAKERGSVSK